MPCCAFAAFLASQVLLGLGTIRRLVLRSGRAFDEAPNNPATEWRLNKSVPALAARSKRRFRLPPLAIAASVEFVLAISTAAYAYHLHAQGHNHFELASVASAPVCGRIR
jgi:hypothetical protein